MNKIRKNPSNPKTIYNQSIFKLSRENGKQSTKINIFIVRQSPNPYNIAQGE